MSFYQEVSEQVDNVLINPVDFKKYHTNIVKENDRMLVAAVKKLNNERYERFEKEILLPRCDVNGKIKSGLASKLWIVYEDSYEVLNTIKVVDKLRTVDHDVAQFWIKEFERPIEELYTHGVNAMSSIYGLLIEYFRQQVVIEKYERVYSKGETFDEWFELADKNWMLYNGEELPFDISKISEKAKTIIAVRI